MKSINFIVLLFCGISSANVMASQHQEDILAPSRQSVASNLKEHSAFKTHKPDGKENETKLEKKKSDILYFKEKFARKKGKPPIMEETVLEKPSKTLANPISVKHREASFNEALKDIDDLKKRGASEATVIQAEKIANYKAKQLHNAKLLNPEEFVEPYPKRISGETNLTSKQKIRNRLNDSMINIEIIKGKQKYDELNAAIKSSIRSNNRAKATCEAEGFDSEKCQARLAKSAQSDSVLHDMKQKVDKELLQMELDQESASR